MIILMNEKDTLQIMETLIYIFCNITGLALGLVKECSH